MNRDEILKTLLRYKQCTCITILNFLQVANAWYGIHPIEWLFLLFVSISHIMKKEDCLWNHIVLAVFTGGVNVAILSRKHTFTGNCLAPTKYCLKYDCSTELSTVADISIREPGHRFWNIFRMISSKNSASAVRSCISSIMRWVKRFSLFNDVSNFFLSSILLTLVMLEGLASLSSNLLTSFMLEELASLSSNPLTLVMSKGLACLSSK